MGKIYIIDPTDSFKNDGSLYKVPKGCGGHAYIALNTPNRDNDVKVVTVSLHPRNHLTKLIKDTDNIKRLSPRHRVLPYRSPSKRKLWKPSRD
jgi:hypothetical protein